MATEFGPDITQTSDLQSAMTPQQGVSKQPVLLKGLSSLFDQAGAALQARRQRDATTAVSEFTKRQLLVADALDQGTIRSSAHARTLMRKNLMDAIDSNPGLAAEYIKAQSSIVDLPGAGSIVKEGSEEEQLRRKDRENLVNANLLDPDADDATYEQVSSTVRVAAEASRQHQLRMQTLEERSKQLSVGSAEWEANQREQEQATIDFLRSSAPAEYISVENQMKAIVNSPNMTEAEKSTALDDLWNQWNANMSTRFGDVSEHKGSAFAKPFQMLYDSYKKRAVGEYTDEELTRQTARALATQKALAVSNPAIARMAVTSELFGQSGLVEVLARESGAFEAYTDFLAGATVEDMPRPKVVTSNPTERAGLKAGLKSVTDGLNSDNEQTREQAKQALTRTLEGISDYEGLLRRDPRAGIEIVTWMSSPDFLKARQEHPELFEDMSELQDILKRNYEDEVWGMVQREFTNANVQVSVPVGPMSGEGTNPNAPIANLREMEEQAVTSGVAVRTTSSGVEFFAVDPSEREFVAEARRLNKDLKPIINQTLKAGAHLEGRTDYGELWNEVASEFLGGEGMTENGGGDEDDDLILEDFRERAAPILGLVNSPGLQGLIDKHEGGGSYDTLLGHSQKGGKEFEGVNVSNMSIGQAIQFSSSGGAYANYSKRAVGRMATPMGRYQIVGRTLRTTAAKMGLSLNTPFDAQTQDAMFSFLAQEALAGKKTARAKRSALRKVWEGFKYATDEELDKAIMEFEGGS